MRRNGDGGHRSSAAAICRSIRCRLHCGTSRRQLATPLPWRVFSDFLDGDLDADRQAVWTQRLCEPDSASATIIAEDRTSLVGFVHVIFDSDPRWGAFVENLHVVFASKLHGVGTRLMAESARATIERSVRSGLYLWVLEQNAGAQAFYQARGGRCTERALALAPGSIPSRLNSSPLRCATRGPSRRCSCNTDEPELCVDTTIGPRCETMTCHDVAAAVLIRNDRVLLCHRSPNRRWYPDVWDFPGGHVEHVEHAEHPPDALRRELLEEIGVDIGIVSDRPVLHVREPSNGLHMAIWLVSQWDGRVENRASEEHDRIDWFSREDLSDLELAHPRIFHCFSNFFLVQLLMRSDKRRSTPHMSPATPWRWSRLGRKVAPSEDEGQGVEGRHHDQKEAEPGDEGEVLQNAANHGTQ